jgi:hypothetical protein
LSFVICGQWYGVILMALGRLSFGGNILIFKGLTGRRLYKSFGVKGLIFCLFPCVLFCTRPYFITSLGASAQFG